jgi:hypothetical protein
MRKEALRIFIILAGPVLWIALGPNRAGAG